MSIHECLENGSDPADVTQHKKFFSCSADLSEDSQEETQCVYPDCLSGAALYQNVILMILSRVGSFIFKCSLFAVFYGKCPIGPPVGSKR